jgi:rhodanese-related sulfurtransferase
MTSLEFFKAKNDAYISPKGLTALQAASPQSVLVVDVRIGPKPSRIKGALDIPEPEITQRLSSLPKDRLIVLYCWETWCSLAAKSAVPLLEAGFRVKEMFGGIAAWELLGLPTEKTNPTPSIQCDC